MEPMEPCVRSLIKLAHRTCKALGNDAKDYVSLCKIVVQDGAQASALRNGTACGFGKGFVNEYDKDMFDSRRRWKKQADAYVREI